MNVLTYIILVIAIFTAWVVNMVKFTDCDFEAPVKCEVVHGVGIIPMISMVTVWFDTDKDDAP